jgi:hypothetical protein
MLGVMMLALRSLVHFIIIFSVWNVTGAALHGANVPGILFVLSQVDAGSYLLISAAMALSINRQRILLLLLAILTLLSSLPLMPDALPRLLVPIAAGIILGTGLQRLINESGLRAPARDREES